MRQSAGIKLKKASMAMDTNEPKVVVEAQEEEYSSSSDSSTDSGDSVFDIPMQGRDLFVKCVQMPDFLLTHAEYSSI